MSNWQSLATQEASRQNCPVDIVLATVEAETSGNNITGDNGNALGYGQVWPKWHMDCFAYAGQELGISVPSDLPSLTDLVLGNDQFSMIATVRCIKQFWDSAGGVWADFTYAYVGPAIPWSDFKRREDIWIKYHNSNFDYTGQAAFIGTGGDGTALPATNYGIVPGSSQSSDVLYGRKYRVIVSNLSGDTALDVSDLHVVFNCVKVIQMQPQYSHIIIYNLSPQTENAIINEGDRVILEAGYQGSQYGQIFDGNVIQAIRDKPDGATYTLTLVCADSDTFLSYSISSFSMIKGQNARSVAQNLITQASIPTAEGIISPNLSDSALTRGKVVFGLTRDYLRQIAQSENGTYYMEDGKVNILKAEDIPQGEIIELSPSSGLIGVPAQSDYGVTIRSLMNPQIKLSSQIHVDNSLVKNQEFSQGQVPYSLDNDGIYRAIKVTYIGDTRGQDWYVEVETITQSGILPSMVANGAQAVY